MSRFTFFLVLLCLGKSLENKSCGVQKFGTPLSGKTAELGEFPWLAMLRYELLGDDVGFKCTGTLVNPRYVLTSASCVVATEFELTSIRLGEHNLLTDPDCAKFPKRCSEPPRDFSAEDIIVHPDFNKFSLESNIALIKLNDSAKFTDYVQPICLSKQPPQTPLVISGWGVSLELDKPLPIKKKIFSTVMRKEECEKSFQKKMPWDQLCSKAWLNNTKTSCATYSGSPVMVFDGVWHQVGVLSNKAGCGHEFPEISVKVSNYVHWVYEVVNAN